MRTLIFNGSPRKDGDTVHVIDELVSSIDGDCTVIDVFETDIASCIDCRYCWKHTGCSQKDDMQALYDAIQMADNIVIASPIFFTELTGQFLVVASRLQTYFCARVFRKETPVPRPKKGGIILIQGGIFKAAKAEDTAVAILKEMNATPIAPAIYCLDTDKQAPADNAGIREALKSLAGALNGQTI